MHKKSVALALAVAITCASLNFSTTQAQAATLPGKDLVALELFTATEMDSTGSKELSAYIQGGDHKAAADWLASSVLEVTDRIGLDFDVKEFSSKLSERLANIIDNKRVSIDSSGRLSELSKSYLVDAVIQELCSIVDLSELVDDTQYEQAVSEYTELQGILDELQSLIEKEGGTFTDGTREQIRALSILAMSAQYRMSGKDVDSGTYTDKFYAINELRTCLDVLYSSMDGYDKISDSLGKAVDSIAMDASTSVDKDSAKTASQLNNMQDLVSDYVIQGIQAKEDNTAEEEADANTSKEDVTTKSEDDTSKKEKEDVTTKSEDAITLTDADIDLLTARFDERMAEYVDARVQKMYEALIEQIYDTDTGVNNYAVNIAAEDLLAIQESFDEVEGDMEDLQKRFNTLELRTRNDVLILIDEVQANADAIAEMKDTSLTWQNRLKTDMGVLTSQNVVTTFGNISILPSTAAGSGTINTNTVSSSYSGKWIQSGSTFYVDIINDAIIEGCNIDIKYLGDPDIIPSYSIDGRAHRLRITVSNNINVSIGTVFVYSKINE